MLLRILQGTGKSLLLANEQVAEQINSVEIRRHCWVNNEIGTIKEDWQNSIQEKMLTYSLGK